MSTSDPTVIQMGNIFHGTVQDKKTASVGNNLHKGQLTLGLSTNLACRERSHHQGT